MSTSHLWRYRTLRALGFLLFVILGFRSASPQALCFHPLRGFLRGNSALPSSKLSTNRSPRFRAFAIACLVLALVVSASGQSKSAEQQTDAAKKANARPVEKTSDAPEPFAGASVEKMAAQCVSLETELGPVDIEMIPEAAPESVRSFLNLSATGALDTTTFSRVVKDFVVQGGNLATSEKWGHGLAKRMSRKLPDEPGLVKHVRGIVSMARPAESNSATTHFFILVGDGHHLDGKFSAFGRVTKGIEVADLINKAPAEGEKPDKPVRITRAIVAACKK